MTTEIAKPEQEDFFIMDKADEDQIINSSEDLKQALVYKIQRNGKEVSELSYIGLKFLALKMSQNGQPLEILDHKIELLGDKAEEKIWYATIKVRNIKTGYETLGMSEQAYYFKGAYDTFGRTKALSKAERNAWRKQIPELELKKLLSDATQKGETKTLQKNCDCKGGKNVVDHVNHRCITCGGKI